MARGIYIVDAFLVDENGTFGRLDGYPKQIDSKNYDGDVDKARRRAEGYFSKVWGQFCDRDDRQRGAGMSDSAELLNVGEYTTEELTELLHAIADEIRLRLMQTADNSKTYK